MKHCIIAIISFLLFGICFVIMQIKNISFDSFLGYCADLFLLIYIGNIFYLLFYLLKSLLKK